jgi:hypothetical protein
MACILIVAFPDLLWRTVLWLVLELFGLLTAVLTHG